MPTQNTTTKERAPVVAIMGHIDHGKSTLLAYIRQSKKPLNEAGGITQHISAYEVLHTASDGAVHPITFLDTPGHEAFFGIRKRGAKVADIVVLVVSAEDGVKPQTIEAFKLIKESNTPMIVAINKIDKEGANIERTKQTLVENEIYIEGWGGDIPFVPLSAKTGQGVDELLDMILLVAEMQSLTGNPDLPGEGMILESNRDIKKGISATCVIKNGTIEKGMYITSGIATAPIRIMENYLGKAVDKATFSSPVKIIGWDTLPEVGAGFKTHKNREEAREEIEKEKTKMREKTDSSDEIVAGENFTPVIIKADTGSSLEATLSEVKKLGSDRMKARVISSGIGPISENDVRLADGEEKSIVIGFNVKIDGPAKSLAERNEIEIEVFDIIYKLNEWLDDALKNRTPKIKVAEPTGTAKVLKVFSKIKDKQILGGRTEKESIKLGAQVKIIRRDEIIGEGKIRDLQQNKNSTDEVREGNEFGALVEAKIEIAPGDKLESFIIVEK